MMRNVVMAFALVLAAGSFAAPEAHAGRMLNGRNLNGRMLNGSMLNGRMLNGKRLNQRLRVDAAKLVRTGLSVAAPGVSLNGVVVAL